MKLKEIHIRDPYVMVHNNVYYLYGTRGTVNQTGFDVYKSNDLKNWSEPICVFGANLNFWGTESFWAPEMHKYKDRFYMLATFKSPDSHRRTHILVSDSPDGRFSPLTDEAVTPKEWDSLDGTLYVDKKGKPHIVFCHEWTQIGNGTVCEMELSEDLKQAVSEPRVLWSAADHKDVVDAVSGIESKVTDGPFLYRLKNDELICIWSSFNENGYMELISRSDNGDIDGNWYIDDIPLSAQKGGHGMIFKTADGKNIFVMHCPNDTPNERPVLIELDERKLVRS